MFQNRTVALRERVPSVGELQERLADSRDWDELTRLIRPRFTAPVAEVGIDDRHHSNPRA